VLEGETDVHNVVSLTVKKASRLPNAQIALARVVTGQAGGKLHD